MKKMSHFCLVSLFTAMLLFSLSSPASSQLATLNCGQGSASVNGIISAGEWPSSPQLVLDTPGFPIQTYVYCMNDSVNLYFLVDAVGDTSDDSNCDECLLWFGVGPDTFIAETWIQNGGLSTSVLPSGGQAAIGFGTSPNDTATDHRIYEFKIPLSSINASPGQTIDFASPPVGKACYAAGVIASMPYDGSTGRDNVWPPDVDTSDRETWSRLQLNGRLSVPTLTEWGIFIFIIFAGSLSLYFLKRKKTI